MDSEKNISEMGKLKIDVCTSSSILTNIVNNNTLARSTSCHSIRGIGKENQNKLPSDDILTSQESSYSCLSLHAIENTSLETEIIQKLQALPDDGSLTAQSEAPMDLVDIDTGPIIEMIENLTNLARDGTLTNQARAPVDEIVIDADTSKNIETDTIQNVNDLPGEGDLTTQTESVADPSKRISRKRLEWIFQAQFTLQDWHKLHDGKSLRPIYVEYLINYINSKLEVCCVLRSNGPYMRSGKFVFRFACVNLPCTRIYKIEQIEDSHFKMFNNRVPENHNGQERSRPIRGAKRAIVAKGVSQMCPEDYLVLCQSGINKTLYENGNLQDLVSSTTVQKIRSDTLTQELDFDKDDVIDVLKMKLLADFEYRKPHSVSDIFIRRFNLDPFAVLMYSNTQLQLLKQLSVDDENLTMHFDATGSLARHSKKRIFYYAGVTRVKKNPIDEKEKARLQPILEFLSGEHDAHNIRLLLEDFKKDYQNKYPIRHWPIQYVVTDFSFALLNAVCLAWNGVKLITYINLTFQFANDSEFKSKLRSLGIETFLELCCGHLSKTFSNDVSKYFSTIESTNQAILKEVFCAMFDISDLNVLRTMWIKLSTILQSKYVNETVESALKHLTDIILDDKSKEKRYTEQNEENEEDEKEKEDDEYIIPDDTHEHQSMYKQSAYYQDFLPLTFKPQFQAETTALNAFYSVEFSKVFLNKYISILSLWTCITQKSRVSNSSAESHFKGTKSRCKRRQTEIGSLPLKSGRICRELEKYTNATTTANLMRIPRKNNCYKQKAKKRSIGTEENDDVESRKKRKILKDNQPILELYRSAPRLRTPTSSASSARSNSRETTPTGPKTNVIKHRLTFDLDPIQENESIIKENDVPVEEVDLPIDDQNVQEQWYKKRKLQHSYMNKKMLKNVKSSNDSELKKILVKKPKNNKIMVVPKTKNFLIDDPPIYIKPTENFVVSRILERMLYKNDYELLFRDADINNELLCFMWSLFQADAKTVQFDLAKLCKIVKKEPKQRFLDIKQNILIGLDIEHYTIFIVNCKEQTFACVDPSQARHPSEETYFNNFMDYIAINNRKFEKKNREKDWKIVHFDHKLQQSRNDRGIFTLNYVQQYLENKKIDSEVNPAIYRKQLQHMILWKSTTMKDRCLKCGRANLPKKSMETSTSWVGCNNCSRWTHIECINTTLEEAQDDSINYFCFICKANTPSEIKIGNTSTPK